MGEGRHPPNKKTQMPSFAHRIDLMPMNLKADVSTKAANESTKSIMQTVESMLCVLTIWFICRCLFQKAVNISEATAAVDKEWDRLKKVPPWQIEEGKTVHVAPLVDLCHLPNSKLDDKFQ